MAAATFGAVIPNEHEPCVSVLVRIALSRNTESESEDGMKFGVRVVAHIEAEQTQNNGVCPLWWSASPNRVRWRRGMARACEYRPELTEHRTTQKSHEL